MNKFLIIGPSGVGKSTALKILSKEKELVTGDLDAMIEENTKMNTGSYFAEVGVQGFFEKSKELIIGLDIEKDTIIAVGAGSIEYPQSHTWYLKQNTIALTGDFESIYKRSNRQMYHPTFNQYYTTEFHPLRQNLYKNSKYVIDVTNLNPNEVARTILEVIKNHKN